MEDEVELINNGDAFKNVDITELRKAIFEFNSFYNYTGMMLIIDERDYTNIKLSRIK